MVAERSVLAQRPHLVLAEELGAVRDAVLVVHVMVDVGFSVVRVVTRVMVLVDVVMVVHCVPFVGRRRMVLVMVVIVVVIIVMAILVMVVVFGQVEERQRVAVGHGEIT